MAIKKMSSQEYNKRLQAQKQIVKNLEIQSGLIKQLKKLKKQKKNKEN